MIEKTVGILVICVVTVSFLFYSIGEVGHSIAGNPAMPGKPSLKQEVVQNMGELLPK